MYWETALDVIRSTAPTARNPNWIVALQGRDWRREGGQRPGGQVSPTYSSGMVIRSSVASAPLSASTPTVVERSEADLIITLETVTPVAASSVRPVETR